MINRLIIRYHVREILHNFGRYKSIMNIKIIDNAMLIATPLSFDLNITKKLPLAQMTIKSVFKYIGKDGGACPESPENSQLYKSGNVEVAVKVLAMTKATFINISNNALLNSSLNIIL
jgi:hypothetical protein